jgi:hypothetical protein
MERKSELNVTYLVIIIVAAKWFGLDEFIPSPEQIQVAQDAATQALERTADAKQSFNVVLAGLGYVAARFGIKWKRETRAADQVGTPLGRSGREEV